MNSEKMFLLREIDIKYFQRSAPSHILFDKISVSKKPDIDVARDFNYYNMLLILDGYYILYFCAHILR